MARGKSVIDDIEILRAAAIAFVGVQHIPWLCGFGSIYMYSFWSGVDLFFVVSGFVIARSLLGELEGNVDRQWQVALSFWWRRAWRLYPAAWLWVAVVIILSLAFNHSGLFKTPQANVTDAVYIVLQFANVHLATCGDTCGVNDIYWSLSLEEQFYFILPLALIVFRRSAPIWLLGACIIQLASPRDPGINLISLTKSDALICGVLLAYLARTASYARWSRAARDRLDWKSGTALLVILLGVLALVTHRGGLFTRAGTSVISDVTLICTALVALASLDADIFFTTTSKKFLLWIGRRSYSIYLIHVPAFLFLRECLFRISGANAATSLASELLFLTCGAAVTLGLSAFTYSFVERPLREWGRHTSLIRASQSGSVTEAEIAQSVP